jgi:hypothetical protein
VRLLEHLGARRQKYATKLYSEVRRVRSELRRKLSRTRAKLAKLVQTDRDNPDGSTVGPKAARSKYDHALSLALAAKDVSPEFTSTGKPLFDGTTKRSPRTGLGGNCEAG